jgi:Fe-S cluster assembly protein SufB
MTHLGKILHQLLFLKDSAGQSQNSYRGLVRISPNADNARNFLCDSLLMGNNCGAHTPYIESKKSICKIEHEATTSKIGEDQVFYCNQRGIPTEGNI